MLRFYATSCIVYGGLKAPVNDILVSAPEIVSSKTRAGGSLSLCHYFIVSSYVIYSGCRLYKHP